MIHNHQDVRSLIASEAPIAGSNARLFRRISWRVASPLILLYFVAFLDRINISLASLTMNHDLGIDDRLYGLAAGIFFLGYLLFAVPSNLLMLRFGARRWIALLMVVWGLCSGLLAFVHTADEYIALRFLVGAAEAGFFPGVIFYLTTWLPGSARAGVVALFTFSIPFSAIIGAPISAWILRANGVAGLAGWQWLFLLEALPAVLLGLAVPWMLTSSPDEATWLSTTEKASLRLAFEEESSRSVTTSNPSVKADDRESASSLLHPFLVSLIVPSSIYFTLMVGLYALGFWIPKLLQSHGAPAAWLGWETAIPFAFGAIGMLLWSADSDKRKERRIHLAGSLATASIGILVTAIAPNSAVAIAGLSMAAVGVFAAMPIFWAQCSQRLSTLRLATGIAVINSVGNLGGFLGPYASGWLLQRTGRFEAALLATSACLLVGTFLVVTGLRNPYDLRPERNV
jgi:ACS family tartrate transporter-like MFS transporter